MIQKCKHRGLFLSERMQEGGDMSYCDERKTETQWLTAKQAAEVVQRSDFFVMKFTDSRCEPL
jgi:hypothetical protein